MATERDRPTASTAVPLDHRSERYRCQYEGCDKSFIRKEHLTRHALSHSSRPSYICQFCQRAFLRNDVLKRHVSRHTAAVESAPRNKRACDGCHAKKLRCDGGLPCNLCLKKGLICTDDRGGKGKRLNAAHDLNFDDQDISMEAIPEAGGPEARTDSQVALIGEGSDDLGSFLHRLIVDNRPPPQLPPTALDFFKIAYGTSERISRMTLAPTKFEYSRLYFKHFHHRWPVLHSATFDEENDPCVVTSSVFMIGAWLEGSAESKDMAIAIHVRLMDHIFPRLTQKLAPVSDNAFPIHLYRAALLNVIFGLYTGKEEIIARVIVVRNILTTVLREAGLFQDVAQMPEDVPGIFIPFRFVKKEQRKRLAASLFKLDAYLSCYRGQPSWLRSEELYFTVVCTFAFWNANGIIVWDRRIKTEPAERSDLTMCDMVRKPTSDDEEQRPIFDHLLAEDIELGLCAVQPAVWQYMAEARIANVDPVIVKDRLDAVQLRLDYWKKKLDQFHLLDENETATGMRNPGAIPLSYYWGKEDHANPGWEEEVKGRAHDILSDSHQLYHLFSLHLYADIHQLRLLLGEEGSEQKSLGAASMSAAAHTWAQTPAARRALWHTTQILSRARPADELPNAISYIAYSAGMIVIWAYNRFNMGQDCEHGSSGIPRRVLTDTNGSGFGASRALELTTVTGFGTDGALEKWIEEGGPASIHGNSLCQCMASTLMGELHSRNYATAVPSWSMGVDVYSVASNLE